MTEEPTPGGEADSPPKPQDEGPPPTPFQLLCGSMAAQVQMALGMIPDPVTKKPMLELGAARQGIEMLTALQEKTQGNLDEEEEKALTVILTHLQMLFVERMKQVQEHTDKVKSEAAAAAAAKEKDEDA